MLDDSQKLANSAACDTDINGICARRDRHVALKVLGASFNQIINLTDNVFIEVTSGQGADDDCVAIFSVD
jgi:hypothetical protein